MKPRIWVYFYLGVSFLTALSGCVANNVLADACAADNNVNRLSRISLRMSQDDVLAIMHAPYEKEIYRVGDDRYDVWFYVTTVTVLGQSRMVPKNLTPLTFRNHQLVGVGYDYYHWVQGKEFTKPKSTPAKEGPENIKLEQELKKAIAPENTSAPQQTPSNQKVQPQTTPTPAQKTTPPPTNAPPPDLKLGPPPNQKVQPQTTPAQKTTPPPTNAPPPDLKLGPPPYKPPPAKQASMSKTPEKPKEDSPPPKKPENSDEPEWNEKDEEINGDAMDQEFNYW